MKQEDEIGEFFKQKFENYSETPPKRVWENIASRLGHPPSNKNFFKQPPFIITITIIGVAALLSVIWLIRQPKPTSMNQIVKREHIIIIDSTPQARTQPAQSAPIDTLKHKLNDKNKISISGIEPSQLTKLPSSQSQDIQSETHQNLSSKEKTEVQPIQTEYPYQTEITEPPEIEPESTLSQQPSIATVESEILNYQIISVCKGEEVVLIAGDGQNYQWSNGTQNQNITFQAVDNCIYHVAYTNTEGKRVKQTFDIHLLNCSIYIPKAFSPNNDGFNDIYKVEAEGLVDFEIKIFSQWGELVFQSKDIHSGWDGRIHGSRAPSGVYIYQIRYTDPNSQKRAFFGTLTLLP